MTIVSSELITVAQVTKEFGVYRNKKEKKRLGGVCKHQYIWSEASKPWKMSYRYLINGDIKN